MNKKQAGWPKANMAGNIYFASQNGVKNFEKSSSVKALSYENEPQLEDSCMSVQNIRKK